MDAYQSHKNLIQSTSGTLASISLESIGKKFAGTLITPAIWTANYATDKSTPGATDVGIYASGFVSAPASIVVGTVKAAVDDDLARKLNQARQKEEIKYRPFIKLCYSYSGKPAQINAMTIANSGGTAWQAPNSVWVYITDARGRLIADFSPKSYMAMYQPKQPLTKKANGFFDWVVKRK